MTLQGTILGTAAYMSPEQAKGKAADKRSDVWAFGAVLYEMLAGTRAFPGDDVSDTFAAVLKSDPAWNALPADTPEPIRTLVRACLQKDRHERLSDISGAVFVLTHHAALAVPVSPPSPLPGPPVARRRRALSILAAAAIAAAATGYITWTMKPPPTPATTRLTVALPEGEQFSGRTRNIWRFLQTARASRTRRTFGSICARSTNSMRYRLPGWMERRARRPSRRFSLPTASGLGSGRRGSSRKSPSAAARPSSWALCRQCRLAQPGMTPTRS